MPIQTTLKADVVFKDGAKAQVKVAGGSYIDIGALKGSIALSYTFDKEEFDTANAGDLDSRVTNMKVDGSFNLLNLNYANMSKLSSGLLTEVTNTGALDSTIDDFVIASDAAENNKPYALEFVNTASQIKLTLDSAPTIASVTGSVDGALTVDDDYFIIADENASSGYSIMFSTAGTGSISTFTQTFTVVITSVTPVASTEVYAGSSTSQLVPYSLKFTHRDSNNDIDIEFELYAADINSGGLQFNFGGADEDGYEESPIAFTGKIDSSLADGKQLFRALKAAAA